MNGEQFTKLNETLDALDKLEQIDWEERPAKYLTKVIKILIGLCKQDHESQIKDTDIISHL